MTPFEIGIALHYHTRCCDAEEIKVPIGPATIKMFMDEGLLVRHFDADDTQQYHPTEKLHAYVEALEKIPLPVQKWVISE